MTTDNENNTQYKTNNNTPLLRKQIVLTMQATPTKKNWTTIELVQKMDPRNKYKIDKEKYILWIKVRKELQLMQKDTVVKQSTDKSWKLNKHTNNKHKYT